METIHFYNYNGDTKVINKNLSTPTDIDCVLLKTFDVLHPVLVVRLQEMPTFNYCKIDSLKRFYFVDSVKFIGNFTYEIFLSVDVLNTYKEKILTSNATLISGENVNKYLSNINEVYDVRPNIQKVDFPNKNLLNRDGKIIMVTIKGKV